MLVRSLTPDDQDRIDELKEKMAAAMTTLSAQLAQTNFDEEPDSPAQRLLQEATQDALNAILEFGEFVQK